MFTIQLTFNLEKHVASRHAGQYTGPSTISAFEFMLSPVMQTLNLQGGTHHESLVSFSVSFSPPVLTSKKAIMHVLTTSVEKQMTKQ